MCSFTFTIPGPVLLQCKGKNFTHKRNFFSIYRVSRFYKLPVTTGSVQNTLATENHAIRILKNDITVVFTKWYKQNAHVPF